MRRTANPGIKCVGALALLATTAMSTPALAQDVNAKAETAEQCTVASKSFVTARYRVAMADVRSLFETGTPMFLARQKELQAFWLQSRFKDNVQRCQAWFASGRTIPYTPS